MHHVVTAPRDVRDPEMYGVPRHSSESSESDTNSLMRLGKLWCAALRESDVLPVLQWVMNRSVKTLITGYRMAWRGVPT